MGWIEVAGEDEVGEGAMLRAQVGGEGVLLARVGGFFYALGDSCMHLGCPLSSGSLTGHIVTCRCHDWSFDVRNGQMTEAPELSQPAYPARSEGGRVFVNLPT